ncbi:MAG: YesL family protein [Clostridiales bacterium]|nr:YesL family protein [Clostridiales bacterium]
MSNFFNMDNPLFSILSKICDMLFISIAYIFLCLPIITIGPASTALYYTVVKVIRKERGYVFREFFKSFRLNFKRASILGVLLVIVFVILGFDLVYAYGLTAPDSTKGSLLMGVFIGITFLVVAFSQYVFPILSRFDMTIKQLIKAAIFMSMRHIHFTILMIIVNALAVVITYFFFAFIFIAPATVVLVNSFMIEMVFKKYMPESEGAGEETGKDEWYLE